MRCFLAGLASRIAAWSIFVLSCTLVGHAAEVPAPFGEYQVVALRAASDVASTVATEERRDWLGRTAKFGESTVTWLDGRQCTNWSIRKVDSTDFNLGDPNLSDVNLAPSDFGSETVDRRSNVPVELICNDLGEQLLGRFVIIDRRVLLASVPSGSTYIILERPLEREQLAKLQRVLRDMKFYDGEASGTLDSASLVSLGFYAEYRGSAFRFHRTVITENLLDRLGVLEE